MNERPCHFAPLWLLVAGATAILAWGCADTDSTPVAAEATDAIEHLDTDLTLRGLAQIYLRNRTP